MVKVYVRGRDIEEGEFAAEFNRESCRWRLVGTADEVFRSQERQAILAVLKEAGPDKDGNPAAISLGDILTATERTDRGALRSLLHKMRKAGEMVSPRAGYYALPDKNPLSAVDAVDGSASEGGRDGQDIDNAGLSVSIAHQRPHQRPINGSVSVDGALMEPEDSNYLDGNGNPASRQRINGINGSERAEANSNGPERAETAPAAPGAPDNLRRCDHCGHPGTAPDPLHHGFWRRGRPAGNWLHAGCQRAFQTGGWRN
jgi:hypothetical protein